MPEPKTIYTPVFHFVDEHLFKAFLEKIPRSALIEPLRRDEALRNRYFPGFRINESKPDRQQLLNAYRREIVERHNRVLANKLCEEWICCNHGLSSAALQALGLSGERASEAGTWIGEAQSVLTDRGFEAVGELVRAVRGKFEPGDVLIFASIIEYGQDQEALRRTIERELRSPEAAASDPSQEMARLEAEQRAAVAALKDLGQAREGLEPRFQAEWNAAQGEIDQAVKRQDDADANLRKAQDENGSAGQGDRGGNDTIGLAGRGGCRAKAPRWQFSREHPTPS